MGCQHASRTSFIASQAAAAEFQLDSLLTTQTMSTSLCFVCRTLSSSAVHRSSRCVHSSSILPCFRSRKCIAVFKRGRNNHSSNCTNTSNLLRSLALRLSLLLYSLSRRFFLVNARDWLTDCCKHWICFRAVLLDVFSSSCFQSGYWSVGHQLSYYHVLGK
jgi:hypothetical protein